MLNAQSLRQRFVAFYEARAHELVPPAPLVPRDDPTLLFNSAGMVQFRNLYASTDPLPYRRAVSVQPCLRAGGKDSDIENVGRTPRHLSFFEMLGNFSFGDYFKDEAIEWGWTFLTGEVGLDAARLWVSVFEDDDEAERIWREAIGVPAGRIVRLGKKDNFWGPAGKSGACGPCSEIYFDLGPEHEGHTPGDEGDRFVEIYNLVFPQFDMQEDGTLAPLANRGIDTGMGLERLAQVVQGGASVFDTDIFTPILGALEEMSGIDAGAADLQTQRAMRVVADHVRGLTFTIAEGVMPSNEGRGYVIRRILRRAARSGFHLGLEGAFLDRLSSAVIDTYREPYPHLDGARERVALALGAEEERFAATIGVGMGRFEEAVERVRREGETSLSGVDVFTLYDTYGFPVDLIGEMARERGLEADMEGFAREMAGQKARSRAASSFADDRTGEIEWKRFGEGEESVFVGYDERSVSDARVRRVAEGEGDSLLVVLDRTPFYAESGGQVGDTGVFELGGTSLRVADTRRAGGMIVHELRVPPRFDAGALGGATLRAAVDVERRSAIARNHTATHLLHASLREALGPHVTQAGSLVAPDRLRFDFTHFQPLTPDEIRIVEERVTREIIAARSVETVVTSLDEARDAGAMALFGEKYGDRVRQVVVGEFSRELCGGTHVGTTGEIGTFLIAHETGVAAGTRRVEALTGLEAARLARRDRDAVTRIAGTLDASREELEERLAALLADRGHLAKALESEREAHRRAELKEALEGVEEIEGVKLVVRRVEASNAGEMRRAADVIRGTLRTGVAILGADTGGKASFLAFVTADLVSEGRLRADEIVREVAGAAGGSGGGKADLALAGAKDVGRIDAALARGRELIGEMLRERRTTR